MLITTKPKINTKKEEMFYPTEQHKMERVRNTSRRGMQNAHGTCFCSTFFSKMPTLDLKAVDNSCCTISSAILWLSSFFVCSRVSLRCSFMPFRFAT